uniref:Uncharacterized protein n=1 Tax=Nonomuraea gerenzanensis TaxID=93944 RepID=A0A1M4DYN2_9ACTN|nr:hypothetical protein BN4615_P1166 [Nonomuraea gerenzanensis]
MSLISETTRERRPAQRPTLTQHLRRPSQPLPDPPTRERHPQLPPRQRPQARRGKPNLSSKIHHRHPLLRHPAHRQQQPPIKLPRSTPDPNILLKKPRHLRSRPDAITTTHPQPISERTMWLNEESPHRLIRQQPMTNHRRHHQRPTAIRHPGRVLHGHITTNPDDDLKSSVPVNSALGHRPLVKRVPIPNNEVPPHLFHPRHASTSIDHGQLAHPVRRRATLPHPLHRPPENTHP